MRYEHTCRACDLVWAEDYHHTTDPPDTCPECESTDVYRHVCQSGVVKFLGGGWSPQGYNKHTCYDSYDKVKIYDRKEDIDRDMRGEAREQELKKLKHLDRAAKRSFGPDAGLTQKEADTKIEKAGNDAV